MTLEWKQQAIKRTTVDLTDIFPLPGISPYGHLPFESELVTSIRTKGVKKPIIVTPRKAGGYYLLSGYKRCQAAAMIGTGTIRADIIHCSSKQKAYEIYCQSNIESVPVRQEKRLNRIILRKEQRER